MPLSSDQTTLCHIYANSPEIVFAQVSSDDTYLLLSLGLSVLKHGAGLSFHVMYTKEFVGTVSKENPMKVPCRIKQTSWISKCPEKLLVINFLFFPCPHSFHEKVKLHSSSLRTVQPVR